MAKPYRPLVPSLFGTHWLTVRIARLPVSINTKLLVAFLGIVALLVVLGAVGLDNLRIVNERVAELARQQNSIVAYRELNDSASLMASNAARILLMENDRDRTERMANFGARLENAEVLLGRLRGKVKRAASISGEDLELFQGAGKSMAELIQLGSATFEFVRAGDIPKSQALFLDRLEPLAKRIGRHTYTLTRRAEEDMAAYVRSSERAYTDAQSVVVAVSLGAITFALLFGYALSFSLVDPLRRIRTQLQSIAQGDFAGRTEVPNRDELGDLTENVNQMSQELDTLYTERQSLSTKLSKYLSPQVYSSIFSGEQIVEIASKRKKLTVFFSDIADFTGTTDTLESEELTNLLNHYLTEMSKIALDYGATIDKFVGDAIIAFFGDPETRGVKEDARACVNMAVAMQRRMRELQSDWLDMGLERPFELRIGINTGFCTVGNFGSEDRMDYTIIGNEVNLAARLESHAEVGGILMAHETHSLVKDTVLAEEGDALTVKGFAKPVRTYSVVGLYDDLAEQGRIIRKEQDGIRIFLDLDKQDRASAIQAVKDVLSQLED